MRFRNLGQAIVALGVLAFLNLALLVSPVAVAPPKDQAIDLEALAFAETAPPAAAQDQPIHHCRKCQELAAANQKIDPTTFDGRGCAAPDRLPFNDELSLAKQPFADSSNQKSRSVVAMVDQALHDQVAVLQARQAELEKWDRPAQAHFARWFGTTDNKARALIYERIGLLGKINTNYSVGNFRRAVPSRQGVFAFVYASDASKVYLDRAFVQAPAVGTNSRVGTITHEMSHFNIAGGTKDHAYGPDKCRTLARNNALLALTNADNFEFYVEGAR